MIVWEEIQITHNAKETGPLWLRNPQIVRSIEHRGRRKVTPGREKTL